MDASPSNDLADNRDSNPGAQRIDVPGARMVCATCHQPLVRQGDQGACVYCLVNFASDRGDDALEEEPGTDQSFANRTRRYGQFEILNHADGSSVELGHGAMGTTYRAQDTVLHRAVALKVIERGIAQHPAVRARFLREARAAAQFQHPNVAAVSQYGEQDGECFYAMELVEGETLEARIRREGPLPVALTLEIAIQVAQALAAAEARGIIHRDLKPTNLMLASGEAHSEAADALVVKVIDFGLARALDPTESADGAYETRGAFVGTPAFASPEQFGQSEDKRIDHRSDIYSLGVTLWYTLTGHAPFSGRSLDEIRLRQNEPLPLRDLTIREVPRSLVTLLSSMLSVEPAARPQSVGELLGELRCCRDERQLATPAPDKWVAWRCLAVISALLGLTAAIALWWNQRRPHLPLEERSIAVLPFENLSQDPADAFFTVGVRDQINADLTHVAGLKVIGIDAAKDYPPGQPRDLGAIGHTLGVRHLLTGSLRREDGRFGVTVQLIDVRDPAYPWTQQYPRALTELFTVQGEISRAVADRLSATLTSAEKIVIDRPPTTSAAAYELYLRAMAPRPAVFDEPNTRAQHREQLALLDRAIALDPDFTLAYCEAASNHDTISFYRTGMSLEELSVDHRSLAAACLAQAQRLQPDLGEVHLALATHYFYVTHDDAQARREIELAQRLLPNNSAVASLAGLLARRQGRWEEAVRSLEYAADLNPRDPMALDHLGMTYHALRRYADWERTFRQFEKLLNKSRRFEIRRALIALERGADLGPLRAELAHHAGDSDYDLEFVLLHFYEGDADALSRTLHDSKESEYNIIGYTYPKAWYEAMAALLRGDESTMRTSLSNARPGLEQLVRGEPTAGIPLGMLAMADALLGRTEDALREGRRACELCDFQNAALGAPTVRCNLAVVYAWTNQPKLALAELDKLAALPFEGLYYPDLPSYGDLRLNPLWRPLRAEPLFAVILEKFARAAADKSPRR